MLTAEQRQEFDARGFVRLPGVFSTQQAAAMEDRVWSALGRKHGVHREDPASWKLPFGTGLQSLRSQPVFAPIGGPLLLGALDDLLGEDCWEPPKHWGQFLVSFPLQPSGLAQPTNWHTDFPYRLPSERVVGALVFSYLSRVPAGSGGTLVLAGSPRVVARFLEAKPHLRKTPMKVTRKALLDGEPWLRALRDATRGRDWDGKLPAPGRCFGDLPVEVAELSGEPGDVVVAHPWLVHSSAPNRGGAPRFMRVQRIRPRLRAGEERSDGGGLRPEAGC